jgi:hypothetical protein
MPTVGSLLVQGGCLLFFFTGSVVFIQLQCLLEKIVGWFGHLNIHLARNAILSRSMSFLCF